MVEFTFKAEDQIILQFVISQTPGSAPEVIAGDDSWFDYSFAPYSERNKRNVSLNNNLEEWAYQLQQAYAKDGEIDLIVRYLEEPKIVSAVVSEEALPKGETSRPAFDDSQIEDAEFENLAEENSTKERLSVKLVESFKETAVWLRVLILVVLVFVAGIIIKSCGGSSKEKPDQVFSEKSLNEIFSESAQKNKKTNTNPKQLQKDYLKEQARQAQARIRNYQRQLEAEENAVRSSEKNSKN